MRKATTSGTSSSKASYARPSRRRALLAASALAVPVVAGIGRPTFAASQYWDVDQVSAGNDLVTGAGLGGTGNWSSTLTNWWDGNTPGAYAGWTADNDAVFSGTAGTVTLDEPISANGLTFKTDGYTVTGSTLTLTGVAQFTVDTGKATLDSLLAGTAGYTKTGAGTLVLNNLGNSVTGPVFVTGGVLELPKSGYIGGTGVGSGTVNISNGAVLRNVDATLAGSFLSVNRGINLGAGGGTVDVPNNILIYGNATSTSAIITGAGETLTKIGASEFRYQGPGTANSTFSKLVVKQGIFRLGSQTAGSPAVQQTKETGFGAAPATFTADAITLDGGTIAASFSLTTHANRGITITSNGGTLNGTSAAITIAAPVAASGAPVTVTGTTGNGIRLNKNSTFGSLLGTGAVSIASAQTLTVGDIGTDFTFGGIVFGSGALTKVGAGTMVLNPASGEWTNTGGVNINQGAIQFGTAAAGFANSATVTVASGATLDFNSINDTFGMLAGAGSAINAANLTVGGSTTTQVNTSATFSGNLTGAGNVVKNGTGTWTLLGTNSWGGTTTINNGAIAFGSQAAIGAAADNMLVNAGGAAAAAYPIDQAFLGRIYNGSAGTAALAADSANNLDFTGYASLSLGGNSGAFTYTGNLTPDGVTYRLGGGRGTLVFASQLTGARDLVVANPGTVAVTNDANDFSGTITVGTGATLTIGAGGTTGALPAAAIDNSGTFGVNRSDTYTLTHAVSGTGGFVKNGPGTLYIDGAMTYTGNVGVIGTSTVSGGTLVVRKLADLGAGDTKTVTIVGGQLHLDGSAGDITLPAGYTVASSGVTLFNVAGNNTVAGTIGLASGFGDTTITASAGTLTLSGTIQANNTGRNLRLDGAGTGLATGVIRDGSTTNKLISVQKLGTGTWTLSGANTHTGPTVVNAGKLILTTPAQATVLTAGMGGADVKGGQLVFDYTGGSSVKSTVLPLLTAAQASNFASGQIRSTPSNNYTGIAWTEDAGTSQFTLVRAAYGDFDLNGVVDADDYVKMDRSVALTLPAEWFTGDFNYDGTAGGSADYLLMDTAFVQTGGSLSPDLLASREAQFGGEYVSALVAAVPEPTGLGLAGLAAAGLLGRRRRAAR